MVKKTTQNLGIGIIGAGNMGKIHAECFSKIKGCKVVGIYNPTRKKAEEVVAKWGGKVFDSVEALIADPEVNTVVIASPQAHHRDQAIAAAKAKKHILCEKPIALTVKEMDEIAKEVKKAGTTFMVGHQMRYHPIIHAVKKAMPELGLVYSLDLEWAFRIKGHEGRCWTSYRHGGFFMELGCHAADLATFFMGPVKHLTANTLRIDPKRITEDFTRALLHFESNASGSIVVSANHRNARQGMLVGRVLGEKGRIDFTCYPYGRDHNEATITIDGGKEVFVPDVKVKKIKFAAPKSQFKVYPGFYDIYQKQAGNFVEAVRTGKAPTCTLEDGRAAVEMVLAIYHQQSEASTKANFKKPPKKYRSDATSHPLIK